MQKRAKSSLDWLSISWPIIYGGEARRVGEVAVYYIHIQCVHSILFVNISCIHTTKMLLTNQRQGMGGLL